MPTTTANPDRPSIVLVDDGSPTLTPLNDLRSACDIRTGALTLFERLTLLTDAPPAALLVPDHLSEITRERHPGVAVNTTEHLHGEIVVLNAATARITLDELQALSSRPAADLVDQHGAFIARRTTAESLDSRWRDLTALVRARDTAHPLPARRVATRPWHVRSMRDACIAIDLSLVARRIRSGPPRTLPIDAALVLGQSSLSVAASAKICAGCILDVESGPIVIDDRATVRPGAMIIGPAYLGPDSYALERATIRPNTAIGPFCKVNGEVGGTIFQGYSNKAHDGYLGDSHVGEWVNLGAGTTGSNLLNTYGEVICKYPDEAGVISNQRTGETFFGCVLGDHVKCAISTRIMTGAIVGTGTMFAAGAPLSGYIPRMTWITDGDSGKPGARAYRFEKFLEVATAAMARRNVSPTPAYISALRRLVTSDQPR